MHEPFHIESSTPARCFELTAYRLQDVPDMHRDLPTESGAIRRDDAGRTHLYFSPGRWLTVCSLASTVPFELPEKLAVVNVSGKWKLLRLSGADAEGVLRFQLPVHEIFTSRACVATMIFDCPALLTRDTDGFDVWTHASYREHLCSALTEAHRNFRRATQPDVV